MILNKCPVCDSELEYNSLCQFTKVYKILKNGKISTRSKRKEDEVPMDCGFISCVNSHCNFHTNCDLEVEENKKYDIHQLGNVFNIEIDKDEE